MTGRVEAINIAAELEGECRPVEAVEALAGQGLRGDRYFSETPREQGEARDITLIQAEALEGLQEEHGIELSGAGSRRNVLTRGIDLNALVGHEFLLGGVRCRGMRLCEPCRVLERYASRPLLRPLVHRGGLRADVLEDGVVNVGDVVRAHSNEPD
jgi:MOSC domain-containing protein YiiM